MKRREGGHEELGYAPSLAVRAFWVLKDSLHRAPSSA